MNEPTTFAEAMSMQRIDAAMASDAGEQPMPQKSPREPFLDQIDEARKSVAEWPEWMRDSTQVITPPLPIQLETRSAATKDQP